MGTVTTKGGSVTSDSVRFRLSNHATPPARTVSTIVYYHMRPYDLSRVLFLLIGLITLVITILFCGISRDDEFYEHTIFVKHRPTIKLYFYTPIGQSDLNLTDLTEDKKREELMYQEFIDGQKIYSDNLDRLWFLPPVLIQLTLTFLSLGITGIKIRKHGVLIHFLMNVIGSVFAVASALYLDKVWMIVTLIGLIWLNVWTTKFVERKSSAQHGL